MTTASPLRYSTSSTRRSRALPWGWQWPSRNTSTLPQAFCAPRCLVGEAPRRSSCRTTRTRGNRRTVSSTEPSQEASSATINS